MSREILPSFLEYAEARMSDDEVKTDLELICIAPVQSDVDDAAECGYHVCDIEHGDRLDVLAATYLDHWETDHA